MKITPEAVKERIAALESAGETSLKEQFYLEALRLLVAGMDSELVSQKEPISFDEWSRKCALQITLCYPEFREKAQYIWDSARETQQPAPVAPACTCPSGDGSLRWPCPVHPGNCPVIPDGWKLVPVEPNGDMLAAAQDAYGETDGDIASTLRAAIAATPQEVK